LTIDRARIGETPLADRLPDGPFPSAQGRSNAPVRLHNNPLQANLPPILSAQAGEVKSEKPRQETDERRDSRPSPHRPHRCGEALA